MNNRRVGSLVVVAVIAGVGGWWWTHRRTSDVPAVSQAAGSAHTTGMKAVAATHAAPAHATITVRDASGPLAGATVRLIAGDGDVMMMRTGNDGAVTTELAPGSWTISASAPGHGPAAAAEREVAAGATERFELVLAVGGRSLTGVVTDASGGPIAGARIDAAKLGGMAQPSPAVASTTTGSDGKYTMTVAEGQLLIAASEPSYAPQSRYVEVGAAGATADFQLVPGGAIEGVVRDERTRQPVPGASVEAQRDAPSMMLGEVGRHHIVAGPDGRFRFAGLRPGAYGLHAQLDRSSSHAPTIVGLGVAEQVADVELLIGDGPVISGKVVDETGAPAPGATVSTFGGEDQAQADADATGAFTLTGLAPGRYMVMGSGHDYVPAGTQAVELATKDVDGVRVTVRRGLRVKGHVEPRQVCEVKLDIDDRALGGDLPMILGGVTTAADGEFMLAPLSAVGYTIVARCPSGDQGKLAVVVAAGLPDQIVKVTAGASIAGRVVDAKGKPVAGVTVMAAPQASGEHTMIVNGMVTSGVQAIATQTGAFELRGLAAGTFRLRILDRGRPLPMKSPESATRITIGATEHKIGVELAVDRPDGVVHGTVVGSDGKPIADAWVSVQQDLGDLLETMGAGGLPGGPAGGPGGPGSGDGSSESRMITIENDGGGGGGGGAGELPPTLTDANGHFELAGLPRVPWTIIAEAQAGKVRGRAARIVPDATITIQALGVTELRGTVRAATMPATFTVELDGPTRAQRTFASADGTFSFGRIDPGSYAVHVTSSSGNGTTTVQVAAGTQATVEITLVSNAIVIGKLVDAAGKPVGGVPVTIVPDTGDGRMQIQLEGPPPTSGPDGAFRLETKAGKSILVVMTQPRPVTKKGLVLEAGKTLDVGAVTIATAPPPAPPP